MALRYVLNSCQLVFQAAPYNNGGRKTINTILGSNVMVGKPGIRLITRPDNTSAMGKGNLKRLDSTPRNAMPNNKKIISPTFPIRKQITIKK